MEEDKKLYLIKEINNNIHTLYYLLNLIKKDDLKDDIKETLLEVIENNLYTYNDTLNRKSDLNSKKDEIYQNIKKCNKEKNELRTLLKKKSINNIDKDYFKFVLEGIYDNLNKKFKEIFNCLLKLKIEDKYTAVIKVIPTIDSYSHSFSKTPHTDKENHKIEISRIKNNGFELDDKLNLILNDNNIELFEEKIKEINNNIEIYRVDNWIYKDNHTIDSFILKVNIGELIDGIK